MRNILLLWAWLAGMVSYAQTASTSQPGVIKLGNGLTANPTTKAVDVSVSGLIPTLTAPADFTVSSLTSSLVYYNGSFWVRSAGSVATSADDYGAIRLTGPSGFLYTRQYTGEILLSWWLLPNAQAGDASGVLQKFIRYASGRRAYCDQPGTYYLRNPVNFYSNTYVRADSGKAIFQLEGTNYYGFRADQTLDSLVNVTFDGISVINNSSGNTYNIGLQDDNSSYGSLYIDGPSIKNFVVKNCYFWNKSTTAQTDGVFAKIQGSKTIDGISVLNCTFRKHGLGAEFLAQDWNNPYRARNITIRGCYANYCRYGTSIAGTFTHAICDDNYYKDALIYGAEFAGAVKGAKLTNCRFEGSFNSTNGGSLFVFNWFSNDGVNDGTFSNYEGAYIAGNTTINQVVGQIELSGPGAALIEHNDINITGRVKFGADVAYARVENNRFIAGASDGIAFQVFGSNNHFSNNTFQTLNAGAWTLLWRENGANNNLFRQNRLISSSTTWTGGPGGNFTLRGNYDKDNNPIADN